MIQTSQRCVFSPPPRPSPARGLLTCLLQGLLRAQNVSPAKAGVQTSWEAVTVGGERSCRGNLDHAWGSHAHVSSRSQPPFPLILDPGLRRGDGRGATTEKTDTLLRRGDGRGAMVENTNIPAPRLRSGRAGGVGAGLRGFVLFLALFSLACSTGDGGADDVDTEPAVDAALEGTSEDTRVDSNDPETATEPLLVRPEAGEPVSDEEIAEVTRLYLETLAGTRFLDVTAERAHGWPRSDPQGRYWYGSWWSGVRVLKEGGEVTYRHADDGADNNGMRTAPLLSSACFAHALWGQDEDLVRAFVRGFSSWGMAMERESLPEQEVLLARAAYPEPISSTDDGRTIHIDYSTNRPGAEWTKDDDPPTIYVHNPDNPHWGDLWVKNIRSKDDIGHMLQAMAFLPACTAGAIAGEGGLAEDVATLEGIYEPWCRRVEDDDWRIATIDEAWELTFPEGDLAFFIQVQDIECKAMLAVRLYGRGGAGPLDCGDGLSMLDEQWALKNDFHQINRSFHEAAAALAQLRGQPEIARALLSGLAWRLDTIFDARDAEAAGGPEYAGPHDKDLAELVVVSAAAGVPLTWREVRFLHDRIREAHAGYLSEGMMRHYHVFDVDTPDGEYAFNPDAGGFFWRYLGFPLGLCASPYVSAAGMPALNCERVREARP